MDACDEAISSIFGLNKCERKALSILCRRKADIQLLARACKKSKPRIAQIMKHLVSIGLAKRQKVPLERGYKYVYSSPEKKEIAKRAKKELRKKQKKLEQALAKSFPV